MIRVALSLLFFVFSAAGAPFTSLYFFGDSLTDTGNVYRATSVLGRYTFGLVPQHPSAPYVDGRFSNGPVWAEHVAARLDRSQDAERAGMSLGWFGRLGGPGNNYAVGGARTDYGGALGLLDIVIPTGIFTQVDFYLSRTRGVADSGGLYFLMGGGNDLRDAARLSDGDQRRASAEQAAYNVLSSVQTLYDAGARQFMLINAPNVGYVPETIADGLIEAGIDASQHFNTALNWSADYLRALDGVSLQFFDLFGFHNELVSEYGFDAVRPCKDGPPELCEQTLFFDSIHPTARVHSLLGDRIADQLLGTSPSLYLSSRAADVQTPEPSTAVLTLTAASLIVVFRMRKSRRA